MPDNITGQKWLKKNFNKSHKKELTGICYGDTLELSITNKRDKKMTIDNTGINYNNEIPKFIKNTSKGNIYRFKSVEFTVGFCDSVIGSYKKELINIIAQGI